MTVSSQLKQTQATIKGAITAIATFVIHHPDVTVQKEFRAAEEQLKSLLADFENRIGELEMEEPQFKGF